MKYLDVYMSAKNIDWVCKINGYFHVASAGGILSKQINDRAKRRTIQNKHLIYHPFLKKTQFLLMRCLLEKDFTMIKKHYDPILSSFINMSRKGFISMDRTNVFDLNE